MTEYITGFATTSGSTGSGAPLRPSAPKNLSLGVPIVILGVLNVLKIP